MSEERLNTELAAIEAALCSLSPTPSNIHRDQLMFLAGKASASRRVPKLLWPMTTAASLVLAMAIGVLLGRTGQPVLPEQTDTPIAAMLAIDDQPSDLPPHSLWENRRLCQLLLEKGNFDAMPVPTGHFNSDIPVVPRDESYRSLLKQYLKNLPG